MCWMICWSREAPVFSLSVCWQRAKRRGWGGQRMERIDGGKKRQIHEGILTDCTVEKQQQCWVNSSAVRTACRLHHFVPQNECDTALSYRALCCYCWTLIARGCRKACLNSNRKVSRDSSILTGIDSGWRGRGRGGRDRGSIDEWREWEREST